MKKTMLMLVAFWLGSAVYAQDAPNNKRDTTKIKLGKSTILILDTNVAENHHNHDFGKCDTVSEKQKSGVTMTLDLGMNGYRTADNKVSLPSGQHLMEIDHPKSRALSLYLSLRGADFIKDRFYIAPGLGITVNNYFFKNNVRILTSNQATVFTADTLIKYDKYKLRSTYLEVPVILGIRIGNLKNPLGIQVGVIGGINVGSMIKQKYKLDNERHRVKVWDDFNINPFKLDAITRITFGNVGLFARYSFTTFFEKNKALELYPFAMGITIDSYSTPKHKRRCHCSYHKK